MPCTAPLLRVPAMIALLMIVRPARVDKGFWTRSVNGMSSFDGRPNHAVCDVFCIPVHTGRPALAGVLHLPRVEIRLRRSKMEGNRRRMPSLGILPIERRSTTCTVHQTKSRDAFEGPVGTRWPASVGGVLARRPVHPMALFAIVEGMQWRLSALQRSPVPSAGDWSPHRVGEDPDFLPPVKTRH